MNNQNTNELFTDGPEFSRRKFLKSMAGGLVVGFILPMGGRTLGLIEDAQAAVLLPDGAVFDATTINAWVRINSAGLVELMFGGCEMGQGTMTGLAQLLAEELKVGWDQVVIKLPDTLENINTPVTPYVSTYLQKTTFRYGTGGSSGISRRWLPLRVAGAQARELLVAAAMLTQGDTTRGNYTVANGIVSHTSGTGWSYGALVNAAATPAAQALVPYLDNPAVLLTTPAAFTVIGQKLPRPDILLKVNGAAKFGIDIFLPGMVFAAVKHCPTIGGVLAAIPARPSGALNVVPLKAYDNRGAVLKDSYNAIAVVADNSWSANKMAKSLKISWKLPATLASVDTAAIALLAKQRLANPGAGVWLAEPVVSNVASTVQANENLVATALANAVQHVQATFSLPYVAHATMEVLNCTAQVIFSAGAPSSCEVWAPTQNATAVVNTAMAVTGLTADKIKVHTTFLGGGLGRKIEQDYISQAIQIAMVTSAPVKLTWFREEDFANDNYRPMALIQVTAGLDNANNISAWSLRTVTPSISWQRATAANLNKTKLDAQAVEGAVALPYSRGTAVTEWVPLDNDVAGIPVGYWRSVGCSINTFAVESIIDMLAAKAGEDAFTFRINRISDARTLDVLHAADSLTTWRKTLASGRAWGMAISKAFGTIVCEVVEISQPAVGSLTIHRVACVVDCGIAVNPDSVEAQMQGGIIHGLNSTLWGRSTFVNGVAQQTNFRNARMMRLNEAPAIQVKIMQNSYDPSGTGEPAVPPVAPAVANAYAKLTGIRITALPLFPAATMGGL